MKNLRNFHDIFRKDVIYDKVTKKQGFKLSLEYIFLEKPQAGFKFMQHNLWTKDFHLSIKLRVYVKVGMGRGEPKF